jgi:hypothetical protein
MLKEGITVEWRTTLRILLLAMLAAGLALAQESRGSITGRITDSSGAAVPGVTVTLTNVGTNPSTESVTGETGVYSALYLIPGAYRLSAESKGFKKLVRQDVDVRVGDRLTIDLQLEVGGVQETVTVTGESTPLLEVSSATAGQVIDRRRIAELPLADGNPMTLARLAPGITVRANALPWTASSALSSSGPSDFETNNTPGGHEFTLDGSPNTADRTANGALRVGLQPPTDAVEEFKVVTSSFDAQQGHTAGATVDVAVRAGTNTAHGTMYDFVRNDILAANTFFRNRSPIALDDNGKSKREARRYNRGGATFGGPVLLPRIYSGRDRTFFFTAYENIRQATPSFETLALPTAVARTGDFSSLPAGQFVYDPATARAEGARIVRDPIQCNGRVNVICPDRISAISRNYLSYLPLPNLASPDGNYYGNAPVVDTYYVVVTRIDHTFNERHRVFFRYSGTHRNESDENSTGVVNGVRANGRSGTRGNRGGVFDYVFAASPTTVVNLRVGYTRFIQTREAMSAFDLEPAQLGFPQRTLALFSGRGLPQFNIGGFSSPTEPTGQFTAVRTPSFQPTVTRMVGSHALRIGYDVRAYQDNRRNQEFKTGSYSFSNLYTRATDQNTSVTVELDRAQSLAALLLGQPTGGQMPRNSARSAQSMHHAAFVQDDWKISRKLTLNLGLRYELDLPTTERFDRNVRGFDAAVANPVEAAAKAAYAASPIPEVAAAAFRVPGGLMFAGPSQRGFYKADRNNFQPRVGFAWQMDSRTVLRGGWALFTVPFLLDGISQPGFSSFTAVDPSPDNGLSFTASLAVPFPNGLTPPVGSSLGLATFVGQGISFVPIDRRNGQSHRLEIGVQRELPGKFLVETAYRGNRSYDVVTSVDLNPVPRRFLSTTGTRDQDVINSLTANVANPFRNIQAFRGTAFFTGATVQRQQLLRPFPQFTGVTGERYDAWSSYDSGQIRVERRFSAGYTLMGFYTYSKSLVKTSFLNPTDTDYEKRLGDADSPHNLSVSGIWELPFGKGRPLGTSWTGWRETLFGGFQMQGVFLYQSGAPLNFGNVYFNGDMSKLKANIRNSTVGALGTDNITDNVFGMDIRQSGFYYTDAAVQTNGVLDPVKQRNDPRINLGSNVRTLPTRFANLRAQGVGLLDLSVIKNVPIHERLKLQLRVEAINALNRAHFVDPNLDPRSATFGRVINTTMLTLPREYQLGAKLIF